MSKQGVVGQVDDAAAPGEPPAEGALDERGASADPERRRDSVLVIRLPRLLQRVWGRVRRPLRIVELSFNRVVALLALVITVVGFYHFYRPLIIGPAAKKPLTGDLNVAVAGLDAARGTSHDVASGLSVSLVEALRSRLAPRTTGDSSLDIEVAGPDQVGAISERSDAARQAAAKRVGGQLNADVLLYGVVKQLRDGFQVTPDFYLAPRDSRDPETGTSPLVSVSLPTEPSGRQSLQAITAFGTQAGLIPARAAVRAQLVARAEALSLFIVGLGYYTNGREQQTRGASSAHDFIEADRWFQSANDSHERDPMLAGLVSLYRGNTALERHRWKSAQADYQASLRAQPGYSRAEFGLAEARFHIGSGECSSQTVRFAVLRSARQGYTRVLHQVNDSRSLLGVKAQLGLGRTAACLGIAGETSQLRFAHDELNSVLLGAATTAGSSSQAATADAWLGVIVLSTPHAGKPQLRGAVADFRDAMSLTPTGPTLGALYSFLGATNAALNRPAARLDYRKAIELDPANKRAYQREEARVIHR